MHLSRPQWELPTYTLHLICEYLADSRLLQSVCRMWGISIRALWWDCGFYDSSLNGLQSFVQCMLDEIPHSTYVTIRLGRSVTATAEAIVLYNLALCLSVDQIRSIRLYLPCDVRIGEIQIQAWQTILSKACSSKLEQMVLHISSRYMCHIQVSV